MAVAVTGAALLMIGVAGQATKAATPNPPVTTGLQLWFEADTETYSDGQAVTSWTDKSGFGRTLTAFDPSQAAVLRRNALNGRAVVEFNGTSSLLKTYGSTFTIAQPDTFFIVYRSLDANTSSRAFVVDSRDSSNRQVFGRPGASSQRMYANQDLDIGGITYPFPTFDIYSGTFNGSSSSLYRNGTAIASGNAGASALNGLSVGALSTGGQYGYEYSHVQVAEILYYSGAMVATDRKAVTDWLNEKYLVTSPPTPPSNTAAPAVNGSAQDGATLTATTGTWTGTQPLTYTYQWLRCNSLGTACGNIAGSTAATYAVVPADIGSTLEVAVTASNAGGSASSTSSPSAVVVAVPPSNTVLPSISGVLQTGATLTAANGTWTGTAPISFAYQWQSCDAGGGSCSPIGGATAASYTLVGADSGATLRVVVTATNSAASTPATSAQTAVVGSANAASPPVVAGLQLWYEADTETYADGQAVTSWTDKSGFGRTLTAFDPSQAPVFHRNTLNGRAVVDFNGTSSLLKTYNSTFTIAQPDTFFIVYRSLDANTSSRAFVFDSRDSSNRQVLGRGGAGDERLYANNDLVATGIAYPFPTFQIWSGTFNGGTSSLYQNGALIQSGNAGGSSQVGFTLGGLNSSAQYGYDLTHSQIAEILYYSGSLSSADRNTVTSWLNTKYQVTGPLSPPVNTAPPVISGTLRDGSTLTSTAGSWTGSQPVTFAYQWRRCNSSGASCANIAGATSTSYTLAPVDVGSTVTVVVTGTNGLGFASATAAATAVVAAAPPANTALPTISGTPRDGSTLSAANGTWTGTPTLVFTYQWQRCDGGGLNCAPIGAATGPTYLLATADVGFTIRVAVTATNSLTGTTATAAQSAVVVAASSPPPPSSPPVTAGLQLWYEAGTETYTDGQAVTTWTDKSGFGRDLTAFDPGQAPVFRQNAVNGRPAIEFDGSSSIMKTYNSTFTIAQPDTFFIVYKSLNTATPGFEAYVFDSRNSGIRQLFGLGPFGNTEMYADIDVEATTTYPFPSYQVWSGTMNGTTSSVWRNGAKIAQSSAGNSSMSGFTVGALSTSAQYGYLYGHSVVAEILFYSGALSDSDRAAVSTWLNGKYAAY